MSQTMTDPEMDKNENLKNLAEFVSSASVSSALPPSTSKTGQTGEYLHTLSVQLREQLDEVERLAKERGVNDNVTSETIQAQQESLRLISQKLGLERALTFSIYRL